MIDDYLLYKNIPCLDLHGEDRYSAKLKITEFINDNYILKKRFLKIIHGKGLGILKEETHRELKKNKLVLEYKLDMFNTGTTIVLLKELP